MKKLFVLVALSGFVLHAAENKKGVDTLSEDIRGLLSQEMLHIEKGMQTIFAHMVKGESEQIATIATDIQNSFIFKKSLTDSQRAELKAKIPEGFISLDRSFHETAGKLAEAAEFEDFEAIKTTFAEMTGKCVACHSTYATHRFGSFSEE